MKVELIKNPIVQEWLSQFGPSDYLIAVGLLQKLKLVSSLEFEVEITNQIKAIQREANNRIAVYPISVDKEYFFPDSIERINKIEGFKQGRRVPFGSEDMMGYLFEKLSKQHKQNNNTSIIIATPSFKQLKTQKISNIVLVDDISATGTRFLDYWKNKFPKVLKRLISGKQIKLWVVFYVMTEFSRTMISKRIINVAHIKTVLPDIDKEIFSEKDKEIFYKYSDKRVALGYKNVSANVVFEHSCPNNLPAIFWQAKMLNGKTWKPLFGNGSVPVELKNFFNSKQDLVQNIETLWNAGYKVSAFQLLQKLENGDPIPSECLNKIRFLCLKRRKNTLERTQRKLFLSISQLTEIINWASDSKLYDRESDELTLLGKTYLDKLRQVIECEVSEDTRVEKVIEEYYPSQCEGILRFLAKPCGPYFEDASVVDQQ